MWEHGLFLKIIYNITIWIYFLLLVYYRKMQSLSHTRQSKREEYDKMNKTDLTYRVITNKSK